MNAKSDTSINTATSEKLPPITKSLLGIVMSKISIGNDKDALLKALSERTRELLEKRQY